MNIYDQLHELNEQLSDDAAWNALLENAFEELDANDIEELVDKAVENEDEGIINDLVSEGDYILSLKNQTLDEWYDENGEDEYQEPNIKSYIHLNKNKVMNITLQEAYNMFSVFSFSICVYKIYRLESAIKQITTNQLLNTMSNYLITKELREKGIIGDTNIEIKVEQGE